MCRFGNRKHLRFAAACVTVAVFLAVGCKHTEVVTKNPSSYLPAAKVTEETSEATLLVNSACNKILSGDFASAKEIVWKSAVPDSKSLRHLRRVIDEYMAIKQRRKTLQDEVCQTQINELKELRQKGFSDDVNGIGKVFSIVLNISEYADKEQKQALLKDPLLIRTIQKAKAKAAEFEAKGKWLDAYTICYSKLMRIYQDNEAYSDYAEQLLEKADIWTSLQDSPCETCEERYAGIKKQTFINAVDILDSSYVNIIDYHRMSIKGIDRCKLLAEVMGRLGVDNEYKITNAQYAAWLAALEKTVNEINQSQTDIGKDEFVDVFNKVLALNES